MRSLRILGGLGLLMLASPVFPQGALRQELTTPSLVVPAGATVVVENLLTNTSTAPLTGQIFNTVTVDRGTFSSATSSLPAIQFSRVPSSVQGGDSFRGIAENVTVRPDNRIFLRYEFFTPFDTPQETRVRFQSTVTGFGGQVSSTLLFFTVRGVAERAPKLEISITSQSEGGGLTTGRILYSLSVTNVGNAPTTGPVQLMITFAAPFATTSSNFQPSSQWTMTGVGQFIAVEKPALAEGAFFSIGAPLFVFDTAVRGQYSLTAVASGGAPRVEQTSISIVEERAAGPVFLPVFVFSSGRVRP